VCVLANWRHAQSAIRRYLHSWIYHGTDFRRQESFSPVLSCLVWAPATAQDITENLNHENDGVWDPDWLTGMLEFPDEEITRDVQSAATVLIVVMVPAMPASTFLSI
jgi:hypothetical protein